MRELCLSQLSRSKPHHRLDDLALFSLAGLLPPLKAIALDELDETQIGGALVPVGQWVIADQVGAQDSAFLGKSWVELLVAKGGSRSSERRFSNSDDPIGSSQSLRWESEDYLSNQKKVSQLEVGIAHKEGYRSASFSRMRRLRSNDARRRC